MSKDLAKLRVVFMGTPIFAVTTLRALIRENYDIVGVYTRPDKKVGRNQEIEKSAVKKIAEEAKLPIFEAQKVNEKTLEEIKDLKPDIIIVAAYGSILPLELLRVPRYGCLNVHASLLPKYRGPSPIQNAIFCGEKETGVTIMLMDEGIDTGDIISQKKTAIGSDETLFELSERLADLGAQLLIETIPQWVDGKIQPQVQDNSKTVICQLIERADGKINWTDNAEDIYNQYRAFTPWPGIFSFWENSGSYMRLKLKKISLETKNIPESCHLGEIFSLDGKAAVKAEAGAIVLHEVQLEGKKTITIEEFLRGAPNFIGSILK